MDSLFIPISADTTDRLLNEDREAVCESLSTPELAAALVLMKLHAASQSGLDALEKLLATAIDVANEAIGQGSGNPLRAVLLRDLNPSMLQWALTQLQPLKINLMSDTEVNAREYLTVVGGWDFGYRQRRNDLTPIIRTRDAGTGVKVRLTDPQARVTDCLLVNTDEPLHVQGLAGTGKTHLLSGLIELLPWPAMPLVLCQTQQQVRAIKNRVPDSHALFTTFHGLALEVLEHDKNLKRYEFRYTSPTPDRLHPATQIGDAHLARHLNFRSVADMTPAQVAGVCKRMVMSFCSGPARAITAKNIPARIRGSDAEQADLVMYATALWREILSPAPNILMPIRSYHLIKLMALRGFTIPSNFSHVIVDESHDLSIPMIQVLERSPQAFISLGDDLQALSGRVNKHSATIRQRDIGLAVRAGVPMERVLNPLIEAHPLRPQIQYEGNGDIDTRLTHYDKLEMPERPCTILVGDLWGQLEWFLRLSHTSSRAGFELLGSRQELQRFAQDLIKLHDSCQRASHGLLFKYSSWAELFEAESAAGNTAIERISRRLQKGLTLDELKSLFVRHGNDQASGYKLAKVNDVRNLEFDAVLLAPDLLPRPSTMTPAERSKLLSAVYVGASRTRYELMLPGYLADWAKDLTRLGAL